jgi:hypothetical protein
MSRVRPLEWPQLFVRAIAAGITGGVVFDLYLWVTTIAPAHRTMTGLWQWIASTVIGNVAFTSSGFAGLGLLLNFIVSIGWAGGYTYLASQQSSLNQRWPISGIVYGLVVYVIMQAILLGDEKFVFPSALGFAIALVAHTVFFGLPVAFVVARMERG